MKTPTERIEKRLNDMPQSYRSNYKKAMSGKSITAAVKSFCLECMQWKKEEVKNCCSVACPLFAYRPYAEGDS